MSKKKYTHKIRIIEDGQGYLIQKRIMFSWQPAMVNTKTGESWHYRDIESAKKDIEKYYKKHVTVEVVK